MPTAQGVPVGGGVVGGSSRQFETRMKRDAGRLTEVLRLSGAAIK